MRYKNEGPVSLYVVMDTESGNVLNACTNKQVARDYMAFMKDHGTLSHMRILTYDQRGTR